MSASAKDIETYKALRASANKGDATAMIKMADMTSSGKVYDPGEPWHGYWMFQAARLGNQEAVGKFHDECFAGKDRRMTDRRFDSACFSSDGTTVYIGDKLPRTYSLYGTDFLLNPQTQPVAKP